MVIERSGSTVASVNGQRKSSVYRTYVVPERNEMGDEDRKLILKYAQNYLDYAEIWKKEPR